MNQAKQSPAMEPGFTEAHAEKDASPFYRQTPKPGTQCAEVLALLLSGRALTHLDALREVGTSRLATHIFDLRHMGWPIETHRITVEGRKGRTASIARYSLPADCARACTKPASDASNGG